MENLPTPYIVGLVKQTSRKTKKSHYQIYLSSRVQRKSSSKLSFQRNARGSSHATKLNPRMRGYLTIWDDRNKPCGKAHPYFVEALQFHGLKFSDFVEDKDKEGLYRLPRPVASTVYEFGAQEVSRKTGKLVPFNYEIVPVEPADDEEDHLDLENLTVAKLRDLSSDYSIDIPKDVKLKSDIISFLKDQLA